MSNTCCLCGSARKVLAFQAHDHLSGESFSVVQCADCMLARVDPQPPVTELARYYPVTHQASTPAAYERMDAKPRIRAIGGLLGGSTGRVLDVGCGKGLLLAGLRDQGWHVAGVELSEVAGQYAKRMGVDVCARPLPECGYAPASFDVVTMFHSLEHMTNPVETLRTIHGLLRPGGHLVIEVPNAGSWYARAFGERWFHCDVPRHLFHFSRNTLTRTVEGTGFRVERLTTMNVQYDAFGAVQSTLNLVLKRKNLLNDFNTGEINLAKLWRSEHRWRDVSALALSELALVMGYPMFALAERLLQPWVDGGTLRIVAIKCPI